MSATGHAGSATKVARQYVEWAWMLGLDAVPCGRGRVVLVDATGELGHGAAEAEGHGMVASGPEALEKSAALERIRERHDASCPHCTTVTGHARTVFGEGDPDADLMFIGEAPGAEEDRTGRPFVGRAGQKLDEIIGAIGRRREDVYIANILKSRPPQNRTPLAPEVEACAPFLADQIAVIRPRVIVALGGPATKFLLDTTLGITRLRGQWASYVGPSLPNEPDGPCLEIPIMPTFHPAYLLRNYTADTRSQMWSDMQAVMARLDD